MPVPMADEFMQKRASSERCFFGDNMKESNKICQMELGKLVGFSEKCSIRYTVLD